MLISVLQIIFLLAFPAIAILASKKFKLFKLLSPVILCYVAGLILVNLSSIPVNKDISIQIVEIVVPLAIPLLLFSSDFIKWLKCAKTTALSFFFCIVSAVMSSIIAFYLLGDSLSEPWKLAGMMVGVYTGGTPNMSAIGLALNVKEEAFILLNASDLVLSGIYLVFLMTIAQRVLQRFLPAFKLTGNESTANEQSDYNTVSKMKISDKMINTIKALGLAIFILVLGVGVSFLIDGKITVLIVILTVTSAGIACSFMKSVRNIKGTFETGEYLLLIFCIAIGSLADFKELLASGTSIFYFCAIAITSSITLHLILAAIFRIDADTVIITSTAAIMSPAFIGPIASVLKNRSLVISGLTTGIIGYAIGNYLGIALAYLLKP